MLSCFSLPFALIYLCLYTHAVPTTAPTGIHVRLKTRTSVSMSWDRLPCFEKEGVEGFQVAVRTPNHLSLSDRYIYKAYDKHSKLKVHIQQLIPGETYDLRVAAVNNEGQGPYSSEAKFTFRP